MGVIVLVTLLCGLLLCICFCCLKCCRTCRASDGSCSASVAPSTNGSGSTAVAESEVSKESKESKESEKPTPCSHADKEWVNTGEWILGMRYQRHDYKCKSCGEKFECPHSWKYIGV